MWGLIKKNNINVCIKKGSFTVEATLLMPMLMTVMLLVLYFLIYVYDVGVMQSALCRGTKQVFYCMNDANNDIEEMCRTMILEDLEGRLLCMKETQVSVKVSATKVEADVTGQVDVPAVILWENVDLSDIWNIRLCWREERLNTPEVVRGAQQLKKIYEELNEDKGGIQ